MDKFFRQINSNIDYKVNQQLDVWQLTKLVVHLKNDIFKFELYKKYQSFFNSDALVLIIDSIDDFLIKRCLLEQCDNTLSLEQIAYIVMHTKRKNEKNYLLQFYAEKLGNIIFDIVGSNFILNPNKKYDDNYIQFIFTIFSYKIASLSDVRVKEVTFNNDLVDEKNKGVFCGGLIELLPIQSEEKDFYDYADLISTIFHEIEHAIQQKKISSKITSNNLNYTYLKIIKETIVSLNNALYDIGNINYTLKSFEVDAVSKSIIKTFKFISRYSKYQANLYISDINSDISLNRKIRNLGIRLKYDLNIAITKDFLQVLSSIDNKDKAFLNDMFNELPDIYNYVKEYSLLSLEYNKNGVRIIDEEIRNRIMKCDYILSNDKFINSNLEIIGKLKCFYINMLHDRDKNMTLHKL